MNRRNRGICVFVVVIFGVANLVFFANSFCTIQEDKNLQKETNSTTISEEIITETLISPTSNQQFEEELESNVEIKKTTILPDTTEQLPLEQTTVLQNSTEQLTTKQTTAPNSTTQEMTVEKTIVSESENECIATKQTTVLDSTNEEVIVKQTINLEVATEGLTFKQDVISEIITEDIIVEQTTIVEDTTEYSTVEDTTTSQYITEEITVKQTTVSETTTEKIMEEHTIISETIVNKETVKETASNLNSVIPTQLPSELMKEVEKQNNKYPGIVIGMGLYSLDGTIAYEYNANKTISGACTVKAPYAMFVLEECEKNGIDIWSEKITYKSSLKNTGSGSIKNAKDGTQYTIAELLQLLLGISDNTAYNMLITKFPLYNYQEYLNTIDGQNLYGLQYGTVTVIQRRNEWNAIYEYINSNKKYSQTLKNYLTNTKYCYLVHWMNDSHNYIHKSGWCTGKSYTSASDCAIIDDKYLIIVLTQDYRTCVAHTDVVKSIGLAVENYMKTKS